MLLKRIAFSAILPLIFIVGCKEESDKKSSDTKKNTVQIDSSAIEVAENEKKEAEEKFELNEENAIDFFFNYQKELDDNIKVKLTTSLGDFTVQLYDNVPYHKANFVYLTKKGYFDNSQFHRVVKDFIIQGGNADDKSIAEKRRAIGRYLLPPDTRKGYKHHRGTISMPSSEINNPHMLASPYEFFIVVTQPGSYHLDGDYTPFGKVIEGMDVVDKINNVRVGKGDWPFQNVYIEKAEVLE
ncbi:peptidylprolyl isomerase [Maribacter halichondriae]|uniref:peptidylprolyl isomerase n=1 Tax=Maribacter halichondriae TaxID=2980554 RepID=UPI0023585BE5|nr:peptidylprolyl isomerase [Maribacter sp. Hal144]